MLGAARRSAEDNPKPHAGSAAWLACSCDRVPPQKPLFFMETAAAKHQENSLKPNPASNQKHPKQVTSVISAWFAMTLGINDDPSRQVRFLRF
jgi:hypothetical protein